MIPTADLPVSDMVSLYHSGAPVRQVAEQVGCSYDRARLALIRAGVEIRQQRRQRPPLRVVGPCPDCGERLDRPHPSGLGQHLPGCAAVHAAAKADLEESR